MADTASSSRRVAVIGGGVSGLAAAHRLVELSPQTQVTLFEAGDRLGGIVQSEQRDGFLFERSADSFITNVPWAFELCKRLGIEDQLLPTNSADRRVFVVRKGKLIEIPAGFTLMAPARLGPMLTTRLLSPLGKLRLLGEYFLPARPQAGDESLASFVRRRLGNEVFERLVQPLLGGIYTADPEQLSLLATMPRFLDMERRHGGLIRGARQSARKEDAEESGARYGLFLSPRDGMSGLISAIAQKLPTGSVRLNARVERISRADENRWSLQIANKSDPEMFDGLIVAAPAPVAGRLLQTVDGELAGELAAILHAGSAIVCLAFRRDAAFPQLPGFGFVVPRIERRSILSVSYSSAKFPGRAPEDCVLLRVFFGGAMQPEMLNKSDAQLVELARRELRELLNIQSAPLFTEVARWPNAMPQFHVGHLDRVRRIEERAAQLPAFALAGNAYHGVGVPHCIQSGERAAERVLA